MERLQSAGQWDRAGRLLADGARALEAGGAQLLVLCTNTMHQVADMIEAAIAIPFPHIADVTGRAVAAAGVGRAGLLGTRYTIEGEFYRGRLERAHGLTVPATSASRTSRRAGCTPWPLSTWPWRRLGQRAPSGRLARPAAVA